MYESLSKFRELDGTRKLEETTQEQAAFEASRILPTVLTPPEAGTENRLEEKPLVWSAGYSKLLKQVLETFPVTKEGKMYVARDNGKSFSTPQQSKAIRWSVDQFISKFNEVVKSEYKA